MARGKQVEDLAKQLANLVGKMDEDLEIKLNSNTQEASNQAYLEEISKKSGEKD